MFENKRRHHSRWKSEPDTTEKRVRLHIFVSVLNEALNFLKNVRRDFESILDFKDQRDPRCYVD